MKLYLIAATKFRAAYSEFLSQKSLSWLEKGTPGEAARLVEFAGRICYMSFGSRQSPKDNSTYIRNLIEKGHESVLEHASFTILADQISRALSHQLVRHRVGFSYSQLSQQYHDESDATFVPPRGLAESALATEKWNSFMRSSLDIYKALEKELRDSNVAESLVPREQSRAIRSLARSVLPNAVATTLVISGNARAWRHLLRVRAEIEGDFEMRDFCVACFRILSEEAPELFQDFALSQDSEGDLVKYVG